MTSRTPTPKWSWAAWTSSRSLLPADEPVLELLQPGLELLLVRLGHRRPAADGPQLGVHHAVRGARPRRPGRHVLCQLVPQVHQHPVVGYCRSGGLRCRALALLPALLLV